MTISRDSWIDNNDPNPETREHINDIWFEAGGFAMCEGNEEYAQTIEAVIKTVYGEIQVNTEYGIPYFDTIWNNSRLQEQWAQAVRTAVKELDFVEDISSLTYNLDSMTQHFNYRLTVKTKNGEIVTVNG